MPVQFDFNSSLRSRGPGGASILGFRVFLIALATLSLIEGLWISSAELIRVGVSSEKSLPSELEKRRAALAASLGIVRGELWAQDALFRSNFNSDSVAQSLLAHSPLMQSHLEKAATIDSAIRALSLSPLDSNMWLLLAALSSPSSSQGINSEEALQMAYLTGQNDARMIPMRLFIAAQSSALSNTDIQDFVQIDITFILAKSPSLRLALLQAYRISSPKSQAFFEAAVKTTDPKFSFPAMLENAAEHGNPSKK